MTPTAPTVPTPTATFTGVGMGSDGIFRVDSSLLSSFMKCTMKAVVRNGYHLTTSGERAELLSGQGAHKCIETYFKLPNDKEAVPKALAAFEAHYATFAQTNVSGEERLAWANVRTIMDEYLRAHPINGEGPWYTVKNYPFFITPEYVEIPFELPLVAEEGIHIIGKMDMMAAYNNGLAVVESKTTGNINSWWTAKWGLHAQVSTYVWAAKQLFDTPVLGAFINAIEFKKLPSDPNRKCKDHNLKYIECRAMHAKWELIGPLERNDHFLEGWLADARTAASRLKKIITEAPTIDSVQMLAQEGTFNESCQFCELMDYCKMGRDPQLMKANMVTLPWNPLVV